MRVRSKSLQSPFQHMSAVRGHFTLLLVAIASLAAMCLAPSAQAAPKGLLGAFPLPAETGEAGGKITNGRGLAVNRTGAGGVAAGTVYVSNSNNDRIETFTGEGEFVQAFGWDVVASGEHNTGETERQTVTLGSNTIGGSFTLRFAGTNAAATSTAIDWDADASEVQAALETVTAIGPGNVSVTGPDAGPGVLGGPWTVTFQGSHAGNDVPQMSTVAANIAGLTVSGGLRSVTIETVTPGGGYEFCKAASDPVDSCKAGGAIAAAGALSSPQQIAVDQSTGNLFVASQGNRRIDVFTAAGDFSGAFGADVDPAAGTALEFCTVATTCQAGTATAKGGGFANLTDTGIAVDPSNGHLYVMDRSNLRVNEFSFTVNGSNEVTGAGFVRAFGFNVANSWTNEVQTLTTSPANASGNYIFTFDPDGAGPLPVQTSAPIPRNTSGLNIAAALIADPNVPAIGPGDLTGAGTAAAANKTLTFSGALGATNVPTMGCDNSQLGGTCSISATTEGVGPGPSFEVCTDPELCQVGLAGNGDGQFVADTTSLAVDAGGFVYAVTAATDCAVVRCRVQKFNPDGTFMENFGPSTGGTEACQLTWSEGLARERAASGVAIDPANQHVYVTRKESSSGSAGSAPATFELCEFDSDGILVERSPADPLVTSNAGNLIPAVGTGGLVYVWATTPGSTIVGAASILGVPPAPPSAEPLSPINVTADSATLRGEVTIPEPGGFGYDTKYRFEVSPDNGISWVPIPAADAELGSVAGTQAVSQQAGELKPNRNYRVRVVATNAAGSVTSDDLVFTTQAVRPTISNMRALPITDTTAVLRASVNPNSSPTTYQFQWGATSSYGNQAPAFEPFVGEGGQKIGVSAEIDDLQPGTTYHFRVVATNAIGTRFGPDVAFTTNACPAENAAGLPDCRAFELVSPADQGPVGEPGALVATSIGLRQQVAPDGSSVAYINTYGLPDSTSGSEVVTRADRQAAGWAATQLTAPALTSSFAQASSETSQELYLSEDLRCGFSKSDQPLTEDAPTAVTDAGGANLFRRGLDGGYTVVTNLDPVNPAATTDIAVIGASSDCSRVVFQTGYRYPGIQTSNPPLYEWDQADGVLRNAAVIPGPSGPVVPNEIVNVNGDTASPGAASVDRRNGAVSPNGGRLFFTAASREGADAGSRAVFMREDGVTTNISRSRNPAVTTKSAHYQMASEDGSRVFFLANYGLTDAASNGAADGICDNNPNSNPRDRRCDLYEYNVDADTLTNLTASTAAGNVEGAAVLGVLDASDSGDRVYFAARGELVPGEGNTYAENMAGSGSYNVYLRHGGAMAFVAVLPAADLEADPFIGPGLLVSPRSSGSPTTWSSRASADGRHLLFQAIGNVTGYDGGGVMEAYRYSADSETVVCVSCRKDGLPSVGDPLAHPTSPLHARPAPGRPSGSTAQYHRPPTLLSDDGSRVFFRMPDALAPGAVEGSFNLYEWHNGKVYLIASRPPIAFDTIDILGASADGGSVFFKTSERLTADDRDGRWSIYAARVGGGFAPPAEPEPSCDPLGGGCQGEGSAPVEGDARTRSPSGGDNAPVVARASIGLIRPTAAARRRASRTGRVVVSVRAASAGRLELSARSRIGRRTLRIGRAVRRVDEAETVSMTVRLSSAARKRLRAGKKLRVTVVARQAGARARSMSILLPGVKS